MQSSQALHATRKETTREEALALLRQIAPLLKQAARLVPRDGELAQGLRQSAREADSMVQELYELVHPSGIRSLRVSPDGTYLFTGDDSGCVRRWDTATRKLETEVVLGTCRRLHSLAIASDGTALVTGSVDVHSLQHHVKIAGGHGQMVHGVAYGANRFITGSKDCTVKVWDYATMKCVQTFGGHGDTVVAVDILPDGSVGVSASLDGTVRTWDLVRNRQRFVMNTTDSKIHCVALSRDGRFIAAGQSGGCICLWDGIGGEVIVRYYNPGVAVSSIVFSPDGAYLYAGTAHGKVSAWNTASGSRTASFKWNRVDSVLLSIPDSGDTIYAACGSAVIPLSAPALIPIIE